MDKSRLLQAIIAHFEHERDVTVSSARATYEAATHEDAKAENKYDTRGLEASYLAESQSKRAQDIQQTIKVFQAMKPINFTSDDAVALGSLITLESEEGFTHVFMGPRGGGSHFDFEGIRITIITGASTLGRNLLGKFVGDEVQKGTEGTQKTFEVTEIR